jgi:hypothetical protein
MGRTACTEPQCLYSRAMSLLPLWAVRPVQSLSACTRVHFTITLDIRRGNLIQTYSLKHSPQNHSLRIFRKSIKNYYFIVSVNHTNKFRQTFWRILWINLTRNFINLNILYIFLKRTQFVVSARTCGRVLITSCLIFFIQYVSSFFQPSSGICILRFRNNSYWLLKDMWVELRNAYILSFHFD